MRARTFSCWAVSLVCLQRHIFVVCTMDVMDLEPQEVAPKFVAVVVPEDGQGEPYEVTLPTDCHLYTSAAAQILGPDLHNQWYLFVRIKPRPAAVR